MATGTYYTTCPACAEWIAAEISVQPEQPGGPETEYLPEHWELVTYVQCGWCDYEFAAQEAQAVLEAARREHGR